MLTLTVSLRAMKPPHRENTTLPKSNMVSSRCFLLRIVHNGRRGWWNQAQRLNQFNDFEPKEKSQKLSFFNWWMFTIFLITFASALLIYMEDNVGWSLGYGLPTIGLAFSILLFLVGTLFYRHKSLKDSLVKKVVQVLVAALRK